MTVVRIHNVISQNGVCNFRSSEMSVSSETFFTRERFTIDSTLFPIVSANSLRTKDTDNAEEENRHICKCEVLQFLVCLLSKTSCLFLSTVVSARFTVI